MIWEISKRRLFLDRTLVMAILNVTPDSFSDGGKFLELDAALHQAELSVTQGAAILDIGGESTRPAGSHMISADEEVDRVLPVIEAIVKRLDIPISIDTSKSEVAKKAVDAGAEIINDISGLRFDPKIADVAAKGRCGLILMHSRGTFATLHTEPPVDDIMPEVNRGLHISVNEAAARGVRQAQIALDIGIGFGKTMDQNLELLANIGRLRDEFPGFPIVVGTSRKSFIGKLLGGVPVEERLTGSLATAVIAARNGANIIRVHDVKETVAAIKIADAIGEKIYV